MKLPILLCIALLLCSHTQAADTPTEITPGVKLVGIRPASLCQHIKYPSVSFTNVRLEEVMLKIKQTLQDLQTDQPPHQVEFALSEDAQNKTWSFSGNEVSLLDLLINLSESRQLEITFTESKLIFVGK